MNTRLPEFANPTAPERGRAPRMGSRFPADQTLATRCGFRGRTRETVPAHRVSIVTKTGTGHPAFGAYAEIAASARGFPATLDLVPARRVPGRSRCGSLVLSVVLAVVLAHPSSSTADGDPPSDVLVSVDVYLPAAPTAPPLSTSFSV